MSDHSQFIVLCEDLQSQVFIRKALIRRGAEPRKIRLVGLPSSAADAFVLAKYPDEVKAFRARNAKMSYGLVVHVDADPANTVAQRHAQFADRLKESVLPPRERNEPITELVPKRNIETWIYALDPLLFSGLREPLGEDEEYRKLKDNESACAVAAEAFADHAIRLTTPPNASLVPSLRDGLAEFDRLPKG